MTSARLGLHVDDHFPRRLRRIARQEGQGSERRGVERKHDRDRRRPQPGRAKTRRLEFASAEREVRHGFGAGSGDAIGRRLLETMAMRVTPFAASSSITETTSP